MLGSSHGRTSNCSAFSCLSTSSILLHVAAGSSYLCSPLSSAALTRPLPLCSAGKEKPARSRRWLQQTWGSRTAQGRRAQPTDRSAVTEVGLSAVALFCTIYKKTLKSCSGAELFAGPAALCVSRLACVKQGHRRRFWLRCWGSGGCGCSAQRWAPLLAGLWCPLPAPPASAALPAARPQARSEVKHRHRPTLFKVVSKNN